MSLTQVDQGLLGQYAQYTGFKNKIINGQMQIDQRNAGASVTPSGTDTLQYCLDRYYLRYSVGSKLSVQQSSTAPAGFTNSQLLTSLSAYSIGASDHFQIVQAVEGFNCADLGWGTADAQTVTLSFRVRSSLTGTFGGIILNSAANRCYVFSYTINSANTFETKTITIPGDTTGTWLTNNGIGLYVTFCVGAGSSTTGAAGSWGSTFYRSVTGQTSLVGTNGATFYITGVQLEKGSTATSFDYRPYGTELALCQRYYEKSYNIEQVPGGSNIGAGIFEGGITSYSTGTAYTPTISYQVAKRTAATLSFWSYGGSANTWNYERSGATGTGTPSSTSSGTRSFCAYFSVGASWVPVYVYGHWVASAEL